MASDIYNEFNIKVYSAIPRNAKILDVGCANGKLGYYLRKNKNPIKLIGLEINSKAAKKASEIYDEVIVTDLENISKLSFKKEFFDCIVLADILEHLKDPSKLIKFLSSYLSHNGILIVSVPNFLFILNRINFLFGKFEYTEKGILYYFHYRFFTFTSIQNLLKDSGYLIVSATGYFITRSSLRFMDFLARKIPTLFAYQFLIIAKK